jgi:hypothetical protein
MGAAMPELRKAVMIVVEASWQDPSGAWQRASGRIEDKSPGGACIRLRKAVEVGVQVRIDSRFEQFVGVARYCRNEGRDFIIGVQRDLAVTIAVSTPAALSSKKEALPESESCPVQQVRADLRAQNRGVGAKHSTGISVRRERDIREWRRVSRRTSRAKAVRAEAVAVGIARGKESGEEKKSMRQKWLDLASWNKNRSRGREGRNGEANLGTADPVFAKERFSAVGVKENVMPIATQATETNGSREVPSFQVELLPVEDIFRIAGIVNPSRGYSASKVVEMINSEHIRSLSKEMKRAAVLMALDAAGVSVDQIQRDARARQEALDAYERSQKKQLEADWARKAEEITQVQSELESIKAHYTARIGRCSEALSRDKARFNNWVTTKEQESISMAEAVELCLQAPAAETHTAVLMSVAAVSASAASVSAKPQ